MDQTPNLQPQFDMDFNMTPYQFSTPLTMPDNFEANKRRLSFADLKSPSLPFRSNMFLDPADLQFMDNMPFLLSHKEDDHHAVNHQQLGAWQAPHVHNLLDLTVDPNFSLKDLDVGPDPYQIRSRGGSFNFGRIRKDSEDFFHTHPDLFKQIRGLADKRLQMENNQRKPSTQVPDSHSSISGDTFSLENNNFLLPPQIMHLPQASLLGFADNGLMASARNTDSTVATVDGSEELKIRKKILLNDRSEQVVDQAKEPAKKEKKGGEAAKNHVKLHKTKSKKSEAAKSKGSEGGKSTENSSTASKVGDPSTSAKLKAQGFNDLMRMKPGGNVQELLGGFNLPDDVKEYLKNSNVMEQMPWLENRKIGTLTVAERKAKVEKYFEKRKKRTWSRRINYDCRKRVADSRLRIKGRFVTRDQAFVLLTDAGIPFDPETITNDDIKSLLTEKFSGALPKSKIEE